MSAPTQKLFENLEKLCRGRPSQNKEEIHKLRKWLTSAREERPSGYMNQPPALSAYLSYYLPLHLPEVFWVLEQCKENKIIDLREKSEGFFAPKRILDLGSGPGTASLSLLLWLLTRKIPVPEKISLVDLSRSALEAAKFLLEGIAPPDLHIEKLRLPLQTFDPAELPSTYDFVFLSHLLNEFGSGPRFRDKKAMLLQKVTSALEPGGYLLIVEPPLKEPTHDLMWIRDEIAKVEGLQILAPCPANVLHCPMRKEKLGWCYSQPLRSWTHGYELAPWDRELERILGITLSKPGFSYLLVQKNQSPRKISSRHSIAITDERTPQAQACTPNGARPVKSVPHRGAFLKA